MKSKVNGVQYITGLVSLFIFLMLQACTHTGVPSMESAQYNYHHGNYIHAYEELEDLAKFGDSEAQYAVGYMKYYGLGTAKNVDEGRGWIRRAARSHYQDAVAALHLLSEESYDPRVDSLPLTDYQNTEEDDVLSSFVAKQQHKRENQSLAWLREQSPEHYTFEVVDENFTKVILDAIKLQDPTPNVPLAHFSYLNHGKKQRHALVGNFKDGEQAMKMLATLAPPLREKINPVSLAEVQKRMIP